MKKGKKEITIKLNKKLKQLCEQYGLSAAELFMQLQQDLVSNKNTATHYQQILAELYLSEILANKANVDRSTIESLLHYMRSYKAQRTTKDSLPEGLSPTTKQILKECEYRKNHSKN